MIELSERAVYTPNGRDVSFSVRDGTNDNDVAIGLNVWGETRCDEYRMTGRQVSGWVIDVGAHIGAFTIPTALDHPDVRVVAVEAVPENVAMLRDNIRRNLTEPERVQVVQAFAARPGTRDAICHYGYTSDPSANDGYLSAHRFVAETWGSRGRPEFALTVEATSLDAIMAQHGIDEVDLIKIDCEGCEWAFLDTPSVSKVRVIVGEYHGGITGVADPIGRIGELLGATHDVTIWDPTEKVSGLFEAVRR